MVLAFYIANLIHPRRSWFLFLCISITFALIWAVTLNLDSQLESDLATRKTIYESHSGDIKWGELTDFYEAILISALKNLGFGTKAYFFSLALSFSLVHTAIFRELLKRDAVSSFGISFIAAFLVLGFADVGIFRFYLAALVFSLGLIKASSRYRVLYITSAIFFHFGMAPMVLLYLITGLDRIKLSLLFGVLLLVWRVGMPDMYVLRFTQYSGDEFLRKYLLAKATRGNILHEMYHYSLLVIPIFILGVIRKVVSNRNDWVFLLLFHLISLLIYINIKESRFLVCSFYFCNLYALVNGGWEVVKDSKMTYVIVQLCKFLFYVVIVFKLRELLGSFSLNTILLPGIFKDESFILALKRLVSI